MKQKRLKRRPVYPASRNVRIWMVANDLLPVDLARALEVGPATITHFVNGEDTSKRIRKHFLSLGCPEKLMEDLEALYRKKGRWAKKRGRASQ